MLAQSRSGNEPAKGPGNERREPSPAAATKRGGPPAVRGEQTSPPTSGSPRAFYVPPRRPQNPGRRRPARPAGAPPPSVFALLACRELPCGGARGSVHDCTPVPGRTESGGGRSRAPVGQEPYVSAGALVCQCASATCRRAYSRCQSTYIEVGPARRQASSADGSKRRADGSRSRCRSDIPLSEFVKPSSMENKTCAMSSPRKQ